MRFSNSHTKLSKNVIKKNVLGSHFKGKAAFSGSNSKFSTKSRFVCTSSLLMQSASSQLFFFTNLLGCLFFLSFAFFLSFFSLVEKLEKLHFCARWWRPEFFGPLQSWTFFSFSSQSDPMSRNFDFGCNRLRIHSTDQVVLVRAKVF